jgi:deoxycytidylate deaminase
MSKVKHELTAIIYDKKGNVLSIGKNNYTKSHPMMMRYGVPLGLPEKIYLHAEIDAIIRCKQLDKAHKISVFRISKGGNYVNAKPCPICQSAIEQTSIKEVEHT